MSGELGLAAPENEGERDPASLLHWVLTSFGAWINPAILGTEFIQAPLINQFLAQNSGIESQAGLRFEDIIIVGDLDIGFHSIQFPLIFKNCEFRGAFASRFSVLKTLSFQHCKLTSAFLEGARIDGAAQFIDCDINYFSLQNVDVSSTLSVRQSHIGQDATRTALDTHGLTVHGDIDGGNMIVTGSWMGSNMTISGDLYLQGSALNSKSQLFAICFDWLQIQSIRFGRGFFCYGGFRAIRSTIRGAIHINHSVFINEKGPSLNLRGSTVSDSILGTEYFRAVGQLDLDDTVIEGSLNITGARIYMSSKAPWIVDGSLLLRRAKISGNINIADSLLVGPLRAEQIEGSYMGIRGTLLYSDTEIGIYLQDAQLGALLWLSGTSSTARLHLTNAHIHSLTTELWHSTASNNAIDSTPTSVDLPKLSNAHGLIIDTVHGPLRKSSDSMIDWLTTIPSENFSPQAWASIARTYSSLGDEESSRKILYQSENVAAIASPRLKRLKKLAYKATLGYGYYPRRAVATLLILIAVAVGVVYWGANCFMPTSLTSLPQPTPNFCPHNVSDVTPHLSSICLPASYPKFSPFLYTVATLVPNAGVTAASWGPSATHRGFTMAVFLTADKLATWLLTALMLAALAKLLRRS